MWYIVIGFMLPATLVRDKLLRFGNLRNLAAFQHLLQLPVPEIAGDGGDDT